MPIEIKYIARAGLDLMPTHSAGAQYNIVTPYSRLEEHTPKIVRKDQKSLTGRLISIFHRDERSFTFHYDKAPRADLPAWREFADSTKLGAASPFSLDATVVPHIGRELRNLVMLNPPDLHQLGSTQWFEVSFKFYMQPS